MAVRQKTICRTQETDKKYLMAILTIHTASYNRAHTLVKVYESLRAQTCKDFEWIISDDGSIDNTEELVLAWQSQDNGFDIIYMMGGNTFYLLDVIRKTSFDDKIRDFLSKGKIYIGSSAGSIIIGNTIEAAAPFDENNVGMAEFTALKLVDGIVVPHANRKEAFINNLRSETDEKIIPLYDGDGIIV